MSTKIKICGLKRPEDVEIVNRYLPDYAGFIIDFPKSHRSLTGQEAELLTKNLDRRILPVGVFVNEPAEKVADLLCRDIIRVAQLHGDEDNDEIDRLKEQTKKTIIKAFIIKDKADVEAANNSHADYVLLDAGTGSGKSFDWSLLCDMDREYFLAGGLGADNLKQAIRRTHPYAVDLSSGVETDRIKDEAKIREVIDIVRNCR